MKIIFENILNSKEEAIAHQCNCVTKTGKGLSFEIFKKYPISNVYKTRKIASKPGTINVVDTKKDKKIINMFGQYNPGPFTKEGKDTEEARLTYFEKCLDEISKTDITSIGFPHRIGCGLAQGKWAKYFSLLKKFEQENEHLTVVLYKQNNLCTFCDEKEYIYCKCGLSYCKKCKDKFHFRDEKNILFCDGCIENYNQCECGEIFYEKYGEKYCTKECEITFTKPKNDVLDNIPKDWEEFFKENSQLIQDIFVELDKESGNVFPERKDIFNAFKFCPLNDIKVVIIGQDCYHGKKQDIIQAMGLSFSVRDGVNPPPSLKNIFKELKAEGFKIKNEKNGNLTRWAKQGVFMYNTALTVKEKTPGSHIKLWKEFTKNVLVFINKYCKNIVFILWGGYAQDFSPYISKHNHIIKSPHPSPFSANSGFFGSKPFSKTNEYLKSKNIKEIDWNL